MRPLHWSAIQAALAGERVQYTTATAEHATLHFREMAQEAAQYDVTAYHRSGDQYIKFPGGGCIHFVSPTRKARAGYRVDLQVMDEVICPPTFGVGRLEYSEGVTPWT